MTLRELIYKKLNNLFENNRNKDVLSHKYKLSTVDRYLRYISDLSDEELIDFFFIVVILCHRQR